MPTYYLTTDYLSDDEQSVTRESALLGNLFQTLLFFFNFVFFIPNFG
jgi:hypothetical protein